MKRRITSLLICAAMLLSLCPMAAAAEPEDTGLCPHHPEHTAECGYDEETGTPCGYVCEICNAAEGNGAPAAQPSGGEEPEEEPGSEEDEEPAPEEGEQPAPGEDEEPAPEEGENPAPEDEEKPAGEEASENQEEELPDNAIQPLVEEPVDWTICIYMCGTDLESDGGNATKDLLEMLGADIPENVRVLAMTGGTVEWNPGDIAESVRQEMVDGGYIIAENAYVTPSNTVTELYEITDEGMRFIKDYGENLNMGEAETAITFLRDCLELAPSERLMVSFWDHGGGPYGGCCVDGFTDDALSLTELRQVLETVQADRGGEKTELVGFDACLMNNLETAYVLADSCEYLIASEETEGGTGWDYAWMDALCMEYVDGDGVDTLEAPEVGRYIVDTYSTSTGGTLAVADLSRMEDLRDAFDALAQAMLALPEERLAEVARAAERVQAMYDGTGLVDLYDFLTNIRPYVPEAQAAIDVLGTAPGAMTGEVPEAEPVILYRTTDDPHDRCLGMAFCCLTTQILYDAGTLEAAGKWADRYTAFGISDAYAEYLHMMLGTVDGLRDFQGTITVEYDGEQEHYVMTLDDPDGGISIKSVDCMNLYTDMTTQTSYLLSAGPTDEDWDALRFTDRLDGNWYSLEGQLFSMDIRPFDNGAFERIKMPVRVEDESFVSILEGYRFADPSAVSGLEEGEELLLIEKITPQEIAEDGSIVPARSYDPLVRYPNGFTFRSLLQEYDLETNTVVGYRENDPTVIEDGQMINVGRPFCCVVTAYGPLISGQDALYAGRFRVTDMRNQVTLSDPSYYILIDDLSQLEVESIAPELYDGKEHRPAVHLRFNGVRVLEEGVDYKVEYQDNVEPGWATITITSLMEDAPGTLTARFLIAETLTEAEEELIRQIPDHLPGDACEENGIEWFQHLAKIDVAMMGYMQLKEEELAGLDPQSVEKLNAQYAAMLEYYQDYLKLTDQNVTVYGAVAVTNSLGKLSAAQRRPTDPQAVEALNKAAAAAKEKLYSVYHIQFLDSEEQVELPILEGEVVLVKLQIPSSLRTENLQLCQVVDGNPQPRGVGYLTGTENGRNYILFYADAPGYYALFARQRSTGGSSGGSGIYTGGSSSNNSSSNTPATTNPAASYPPTVRQPKRGGALTVSPTDPKAGTTVTITATPNAGYVVDTISVTLSNGTPVSVQENSDGTYSFTQPSSRVTVTGTFRPAQTGTAEETPTQSGAYTDVSAGDWCYEAVQFVQANSLMNGYSDGRFAPNTVLTRAQLAQILYNKEGRPSVDYEMNFTDVQANAWCADAVRWAASRGIVGGYEDGTFRPNAPITREQLAVMLWRYAGSPAPSSQELNFTDAGRIGGYAREGLRWAVENRIVNGYQDGRVNPQGQATRAQTAQMLKNFVENT